MQRYKANNIFQIFNYTILTFLALICILPYFNVLAISLSGKTAIISGYVHFWPKNVTITAYEYVLERKQFWQALYISFQRIILGGGISLLLTIVLSYPLSKPPEKFRGRAAYVWIIFFTMLFDGGLIPRYTLIKDLNLLDTIWVLVLPVAVQGFNIILLLNFFRQVPSELEEAAHIDGASHWRTLWQIYVPVSVPAIATMVLFTMVLHWNSWFDGLIFMNSTENYPIQSYLRTMIFSPSSIMNMSMSELRGMALVCDRNIRNAQIIIGTIPILLVYPFLQKYFVSGIVLGSVKG